VTQVLLHDLVMICANTQVISSVWDVWWTFK